MVSPTTPYVLVGQVGPTSFKFLQQPKQSRPDRAGVIAAPFLLGAWGVGERLLVEGAIVTGASERIPLCSNIINNLPVKTVDGGTRSSRIDAVCLPATAPASGRAEHRERRNCLHHFAAASETGRVSHPRETIALVLRTAGSVAAVNRG